MKNLYFSLNIWNLHMHMNRLFIGCKFHSLTLTLVKNFVIEERKVNTLLTIHSILISYYIAQFCNESFVVEQREIYQKNMVTSTLVSDHEQTSSTCASFLSFYVRLLHRALSLSLSLTSWHDTLKQMWYFSCLKRFFKLTMILAIRNKVIRN